MIDANVDYLGQDCAFFAKDAHDTVPTTVFIYTSDDAFPPQTAPSHRRARITESA